MERSYDAALEERPEILNRVRVDVATHVLAYVIDDFVAVGSTNRLVGVQFIGYDQFRIRCERIPLVKRGAFLLDKSTPIDV